MTIRTQGTHTDSGPRPSLLESTLLAQRVTDFCRAERVPYRRLKNREPTVHLLAIRTSCGQFVDKSVETGPERYSSGKRPNSMKFCATKNAMISSSYKLEMFKKNCLVCVYDRLGVVNRPRSQHAPPRARGLRSLKAHGRNKVSHLASHLRAAFGRFSIAKSSD